MKASELRIGNWVMLSGKPCQVQTVGMWLHTDTTVDEVPIESIEAIPLSEEWLLKFGFKKSRLGYDLDEFSLYYNHSGALPIYGPYWKEWEAGYNIQYVHQLQNIYFAMTGRELIFKEQ